MNKYIVSLILTLIGYTAYAQNGVNSPYSRYGFGLLSDRSTGFNKGMGGVAQGFRNGEQINIANPASYSEVDSLSALFDLGISLQNGNYKMGGAQQNVRNSSFDYFAFQFRAAKNLGMTVGIMPISNIKYDFASQSESLAGTENVTSNYSYKGDGGLREVVVGAGWRPVKPLSVGANISYVWGDYSHIMNLNYNDASAFNLRRTYEATISTYNAQLGLQYIQPVSKDSKFVVGATYLFGHDINNDAFRTTQMLHTDASQGMTVIDTQTLDTVKNAFQYPNTYTVGVTYYHKNNLRIGADFELQKWGECKFPTEVQNSAIAYQSVTGVLNDRKKISLGFDWTPNSLERSLLKRTTYKVGGYYSESYANADLSNQITNKPYEFGLSAGFSMPIRTGWLYFPNTSKLNVSVQWVHTNIPYLNTSNNLKSALSENYLRFCIGMTINEHWFYKWKLD